jgi:hypothetical protein
VHGDHLDAHGGRYFDAVEGRGPIVNERIGRARTQRRHGYAWVGQEPAGLGHPDRINVTLLDLHRLVACCDSRLQAVSQAPHAEHALTD